MWLLGDKEMNMPPEEFQDRLTFVGGTNKYDEPNFVIWWGQYAWGPGSFRSGGVWAVDEAYFKGYRDLLKGSGEPCWCLGQWNPPEAYGTPERWYVENLDETTGLQILGEFGYSGKYELLFNLRWHEIENGKIQFHTLPLNNSVFDMVAKIVSLAKDISIEKIKAAYLAAKEAEKQENILDVERHLRDNAIPFQGAVSFTRQGIRSTAIDIKARHLHQKWGELARAAQGFQKGIQAR